jgi:hypothetical protein
MNNSKQIQGVSASGKVTRANSMEKRFRKRASKIMNTSEEEILKRLKLHPSAKKYGPAVADSLKCWLLGRLLRDIPEELYSDFWHRAKNDKGSGKRAERVSMAERAASNDRFLNPYTTKPMIPDLNAKQIKAWKKIKRQDRLRRSPKKTSLVLTDLYLLPLFECGDVKGKDKRFLANMGRLYKFFRGNKSGIYSLFPSSLGRKAAEGESSECGKDHITGVAKVIDKIRKVLLTAGVADFYLNKSGLYRRAFSIELNREPLPAESLYIPILLGCRTPEDTSKKIATDTYIERYGGRRSASIAKELSSREFFDRYLAHLGEPKFRTRSPNR